MFEASPEQVAEAIRAEKHRIADRLLSEGDVYMHFMVDWEGVVVPNPKKLSTMVLHLGYDLPLPIPDLRTDEKGVSGTLSFEREPHFCKVPWEAVMALSNEKGMGRAWSWGIPDAVFDSLFEKNPPKDGDPVEYVAPCNVVKVDFSKRRKP